MKKSELLELLKIIAYEILWIAVTVILCGWLSKIDFVLPIAIIILLAIGIVAKCKVRWLPVGAVWLSILTAFLVIGGFMANYGMLDMNLHSKFEQIAVYVCTSMLFQLTAIAVRPTMKIIKSLAVTVASKDKKIRYLSWVVCLSAVVILWFIGGVPYLIYMVGAAIGFTFNNITTALFCMGYPILCAVYYTLVVLGVLVKLVSRNADNKDQDGHIQTVEPDEKKGGIMTKTKIMPLICGALWAVKGLVSGVIRSSLMDVDDFNTSEMPPLWVNAMVVLLTVFMCVFTCYVVKNKRDLLKVIASFAVCYIIFFGGLSIFVFIGACTELFGLHLLLRDVVGIDAVALIILIPVIHMVLTVAIQSLCCAVAVPLKNRFTRKVKT